MRDWLGEIHPSSLTRQCLGEMSTEMTLGSLTDQRMVMLKIKLSEKGKLNRSSKKTASHIILPTNPLVREQSDNKSISNRNIHILKISR